MYKSKDLGILDGMWESRNNRWFVNRRHTEHNYNACPREMNTFFGMAPPIPPDTLMVSHQPREHMDFGVGGGRLVENFDREIVHHGRGYLSKDDQFGIEVIPSEEALPHKSPGKDDAKGKKSTESEP
jgi:hypothetical protein